MHSSRWAVQRGAKTNVWHGVLVFVPHRRCRSENVYSHPMVGEKEEPLYMLPMKRTAHFMKLKKGVIISLALSNAQFPEMT